MDHSPPDGHNHDHRDRGNHQSEIPPTPNSTQPPNLNPTVRGHGCGCECTQNIGEGDSASSSSNDGRTSCHQTADSEEESDFDDNMLVDDDHSINGDEGPEEHLIEVGDLGMLPVRMIRSSLARHRRCTCLWGLDDGQDDYPNSNFASPADSGILPSLGSMVVEVGSAELSMSSSEISLSTRNASSSALLAHMVGAFGDERACFPAPGSLFTQSPIWPNSIAGVGGQYALVLNVHENESSD